MKEFFKNLRRYKVSSVLNILGLSIAFAAAYAILVQVNYDLGFNRSLKDAERVFRLETAIFSEFYDGKTSDSMNDYLGQTFGDDTTMVEAFGRTRFEPLSVTLKLNTDGAEHHVEVNACEGTKGFPETVGFELVNGSFDRLNVPNCVLISKAFAKTHGLQLDDVVQDEEDESYTIVGVYEDFSKNCDFYGVQMFCSVEPDGWQQAGNWNYAYFYKLKEAWMKDAFIESLYPKYYEFNESRMKMYYEWTGQEYPDTMTLEKFRADEKNQLFLTPIGDIHFADVDAENKRGNATTTYTLLAIGVVILIIAFVNFINFFMAMVPRRIRRVNTEKIFGCTARRLRLGFVGEAIGLVLLGLLLAAYIIFMVAPEVSAGSFISTSIALEENWDVVLMMIGVGVVLAIVSSIYPAYYITSVSPAFAIKGSFGNTAKGRHLRSALLGLQFFISLALIICTMFIKLQHSFMMNYDMGFNREYLLSAQLDGQAMVPTEDGQRPSLVSLLKENPMIKDVTFSQNRMVSYDGRQGWGRAINDDINCQVFLDVQIVTPEFLEVMGIDITEGRNFEPRDMQNPNGTIIYNETARRKYNLTMETEIKWQGGVAEVAGFCMDAKMQPLQYETQPMGFYIYGQNLYYPQLYIRTTEGADFEAVKAYIEESILKLAPKAKPEDIKVEFFDEQLGREYEKEKELVRLVSVFSVVAILIALMGVFGLVFFETQYRRREIAVRRVHGAKIAQILGMFVGQYARMVLVAFLFAVPVSYLIMQRWLQGYAYHIPLYWWVFALALLIVLAVTSAIVLARSWHAAKENPVEALYKE